jgi:aminodeoxychorismate lyase
MIVFLDGKFVSEHRAVVSVFDRSFLYGDGLFETMLIANRVPFCWRQHLERLERGAAFLDIRLPFTPGELRGFVDRLLVENQMSQALLRLTLSRGIGLRGYSPRGAHSPTLVMSLHSAEACGAGEITAWHLMTSGFRLPAREPLAQFKSCNKLPQILARAQAEAADVDEALLLNTDGFVVEGAASSFFWIEAGAVYTPPLASGILSGVTRQVVFEICGNLGLGLQERNISAKEILRVDGVFLTLSSLGIVEGQSLDGHPLSRSPFTTQIRTAYWDRVRHETGGVL